MKNKKKILIPFLVIAFIAILIYVLFAFIHITWIREELHVPVYNPPPELIGGGDGTEEHPYQVLGNGGTVITINPTNFSRDSYKVRKYKEEIRRQTTEKALEICQKSGYGEYGYRFLGGTPNSLSYMIYSDEFDVQYKITVKVKNQKATIECKEIEQTS